MKETYYFVLYDKDTRVEGPVFSKKEAFILEKTLKGRVVDVAVLTDPKLNREKENAAQA